MSNIDKREKVLTVENLKKHFYSGVGKKKLVVPAVDGVSFEIYKREVLGLVGESGCGKTTTGRTLIKIYDPTDGKVTFNGVEIAAGYQSNLDKIKEIKEQLKKDIRSLKPNGKKIIALEEKTEREIIKLNHELYDLKENHNKELQKAKEPLLNFKGNKYSVKNNYKLQLEVIEYDINEKRKALKDLTVNNSKVIYGKELAMAKLSFERSFDGLKNSAALTKEEINRRVEELKEKHEKTLNRLESKYQPLIVKDEEKKLSKAEIKPQLKELKTELKEKTLLEKKRFKEEINNIPKPNFLEVRKNIKRINDNFKAEKDKILKTIKTLKKETKEKSKELSNAKTLTDEEKANLKNNIKELKLKTKEAIRKEKEKIKEVKKINRSEEAIEEVTKMQMIFQDPISSLNPRMTVREIVSEGLVIQGKLSKDEIDKKVEETLELVGLSPEFAARYPHEFSGGQRQRIGVARALIMNPDLVIADEPVSSLDVSIRAQVINLLTQLKDDLGLTILFIAHDLSVIKFFCDRIAVMYYGKIVELATSEDLFRNPMHPYTISLLSAVPQPDPDYEKGRKRLFYDPRMHDYRFDKPTFRKIGEDHFVLANDKEFAEMKKKYEKIT